MSVRPLVAVTMGDPAGVGPEVALKALAEPEVHELCRPVVFGSAAVLAREAELLEIEVELAADAALERDDASPARVVVYETAATEAVEAPRGEVSRAGGEAAVSAVRAATELALEGRVHALATGPLNKESMRTAGYRWAGHTELLADLCGVDDVAMLLIGKRLRVAHVTTHVALERVPGLVTEARLRSVARIAHEAMRRLGIGAPRIGVAGLNPHAGEGGMFGDEEERVVAPTIAALREQGLDVSGPVAGDAVFIDMERRFDIVVVMYHDQGHIPIKLLERDDAVNVTGGLPIVRTSVDHGTAFDIAGQGIASERSMIAALRMAALLADPAGDRPRRRGPAVDAG